ncbi:hypothetical protein GCM10011316_27300 [Roseibium aquae]|uniref:Flagellar biosynthesis protein R n=1 Tax=Roseibium aquae TaxID=1323746 RepID=A0A916TM44_9HYPH|nr:flagellar biosynthesis protein R [Roseibium aquae]GGB53806.1 hypothetical protein GCM10011316_27300 [Roseibium aquae]
MRRSSKDIERIYHLQRQIYLFSQWLLQKLDAQAETLTEKERRILTALSGGELAQHDRFIANAAERLRKILHELMEITAAREKMNAEFSRQMMLLKTMEERLRKIRMDEARQAEQQSLLDLMDIRFR